LLQALIVGGGEAAILGVRDDAQAGVLGQHRFEPGARAVGRGVVDDDHLGALGGCRAPNALETGAGVLPAIPGHEDDAGARLGLERGARQRRRRRRELRPQAAFGTHDSAPL
jgi:hypothetical protein